MPEYHILLLLSEKVSTSDLIIEMILRLSIILQINFYLVRFDDLIPKKYEFEASY
jgi:hypothetical protein